VGLRQYLYNSSWVIELDNYKFNASLINIKNKVKHASIDTERNRSKAVRKSKSKKLFDKF